MSFNPLDYPLCFDKPRRLTDVYAWHEHIPFAFTIVQMLKPKIFVELGTHKGDSYCAFCQAVDTLGLDTACFAVDTWKGDEQSRTYGSEILDELRAYHDPLYGRFSQLIQRTFDEALNHFSEGSIDLLHIDGCHTFEAVKHDFKNWLPKMSRNGVILFHDINVREMDFGVWRLWEELKDKYPSFEFKHGHGLGIIATGDGLPEEMRAFFETGRTDVNSISRFYYHIGNKIMLMEKNLSNDIQISQLSEANNRKEEQIRYLEETLNSMRGSLTWRMLMKFDKVIGRRLPGRKKFINYYTPLVMGIRIITNEGWRAFFVKLKRRLRSEPAPGPKYIPPTPEELQRFKEEIKTFHYLPRISIITPVYNVDEKWLRLCIESVLGQVYENWELCLADDASTKVHIKKVIEEYLKKDARIKVKYLDKNLGIAGASNAALSLATGEFIHLLDNDDEITPDALYEIVKLLNKNEKFDLIYADEDRIDTKGNFFLPYFKPDWSPDLLFSGMYIGHSTYRRQIVMDLGGFRSKYDFSQDYDLALRITEKTQRIGHVRKILYHWRTLPGSAAGGGKDFARVSNIGALQAAIDRRGYNAVAVEYAWVNRLKFILSEYPFVSIIIPTDDKENLFSTVDSILKKTNYPNYEIVVVTNSNLGNTALNNYKHEHRFRVDFYDKPFNFSAKCNSGARKANGDYFLFLNDDMEVLDSNWIESMVEIFGRKEVGAVSPKLVYQNNTIQHAGLVTGVRGLVGTAFHTQPRNSSIYFNYIQSTRNASALSAACLMVPKNIYESIGGFDEINTPIRHSDFDLCFRIREKGFLLVYTPFATLKHIGHVSIGRVEKEKPQSHDNADLYLIKRFGQYMSYDPYYTENMRDLLYEDVSSGYKLVPGRQYQPVDKEKSILFVTHDLSMSGAPNSIYNLATYLLDKGYFVMVLSPVEGGLMNKFQEAGIPVIIDAITLEKPMNGFLENFDIVVANTILSWNLVHIGKDKGIPVIWFIHESKIGKKLAGENPSMAKAFGAANTVLFPSRAAANLYNKFNNKNNFEIMYQGISTPVIKGEPKPRQEGKFYILHVGSIEPRKGQEILAECILNLPDKFKDIFEFYFIGRVLIPDYYKKLKDSIGSLKNVHFTGEVSEDELFRLYGMADVFVCTSRDETFSLTILEAMSQGKAVISTSVGGIPEIIDNEINGILIPKEDTKELTRNIIRLYEDKTFKSRLGEDAYKKFIEMFTLEKYGDRFLRILKDVLLPKAPDNKISYPRKITSDKIPLITNIIENTPSKVINETKEINDEIRSEYLKTHTNEDPAEYLEYSKGWHYVIFDFIRKYNGEKALDIGALYGTTSVYMSRIGISVTALDGYVDNIPESIKLKYKIQFLFTNLEDSKPPSLPSKYFDLVVMSEVLEHLNYNPIPALIAIRNSMKAGGCLIITTPDNDNYPLVPDGPVARKCHFFDIPVWSDNSPRQSFPHSKQYTYKEFKELLNVCGFYVEDFIKYDYEGIHMLAIAKLKDSWEPSQKIKEIIESVWKDFLRHNLHQASRI